MTNEPQQPPAAPQPGPGPDAAPPQIPAIPGQPPVAPPASPPADAQLPQPRWGQYAPPVFNPPAGNPPAGGQPQQPAAPQQWGQQWGQPQQPQWGQYAPPPGPQQPGQGYGQPGYGQPPYGQPGYGRYVAPPKPGVIPLRPLRLGEVLDGAFQAARRNGKAMFGSALIFQILTAVLTLAVTLTAFGSTLGTELLNGSFAESAPTEAQLNQLLGGVLQLSLALIAVSLISGLLEMVLQGALVVPVLRAVLNQKTGFGQMWQLVKPRIGSLLLLAVVYGLAFLVAAGAYFGILVGLLYATGSVGSGSNGFAAIGIALLLSLPFLAAGIWAGTKVLIAPAAIVVENIGVFAAIKRSWQLTARNWWRTFGISVLAAVIASFIGGVITTPVTLLLGFLLPVMMPHATAEQMVNVTLVSQVISTFIGALVGAVTVAFQTGVMALIYVDLRMRRDGFDVSLLKESETGTDDGGIPGRDASVTAVAGRQPGAPYPPQQYPQQPYPPQHYPPAQQYPPTQYPPAQQPPAPQPPAQFTGQ